MRYIKTGFSPKTSGGNGGVTTLFGLENHCIAGKGGTSTSINGTDAAGYGGCGGVADMHLVTVGKVLADMQEYPGINIGILQVKLTN